MRASMQMIANIVRKEFLQVRQDKRMLFVSVLAPVLQVVLLGYAATTDITNARLAVCDLDRTEESRTFIRRFTASGYFMESHSVELPDQVDPLIARAEVSMALI